jgi:hypothetical protein
MLAAQNGNGHSIFKRSENVAADSDSDSGRYLRESTTAE